MLLVPIEDKGSWRRPPWLITALLLVNVIVHMGTESAWRDPTRQLDNMLEGGQAELLVEKEWPLFLDWIEDDAPGLWLDVHDTEPANRFRLLKDLAWYDLAFSRYVHDYWREHPPAEAWRRARARVESWRAQLPGIRWGLIPDDPDLISLFTSMFMHGGWMHLFGNMLFLLLFGVPMERHWGALRLGGMYLMTGLAADGLFIATNPGTTVPLVGASGAISGLMGIYCASYGLRRIEFFYTLGFLFGSFRAPALAVFPLWLGWELVQAAAFDTQVAYMAHAGGLISGLALTLALRRVWPPARTTHPVVDVAGKQGAKAPPGTVPPAIERLADALEFDRALSMSLRRLDECPDRPALWHAALEWLPHADTPDAGRLLRLAARKRYQGEIEDRLLVDIWQRLRALDMSMGNPGAAALLVIAESLFRLGHREAARELVERMERKGISHPRLNELRGRLD